MRAVKIGLNLVPRFIRLLGQDGSKIRLVSGIATIDSAPGKVILHGEHAVVYGKKAVTAAIGLRTTVKLEPTHDKLVSLNLLNFETTWSWNTRELHKVLQKRGCLQNFTTGKATNTPCSTSEDDQWFSKLADHCKVTGINKKLTEDAVRAFLFLVGNIMKDCERLPAFSVHVQSSIPVGAGLGSSASYCVGLSTALLAATRGIPLPPVKSGAPETHSGDFQMMTRGTPLGDKDLELICRWSLEGEKLFHGRPSGIDNSISTYGGILAFKDGNIELLTRVPQLKILVIHTKVPRSTKDMMSGLRERYQELPAVYSPLFEAIGAIAEESCVYLEQMHQCQVEPNTTEQDTEQHYSVLEKLIDMNQQLLVMLGVSHSSLDQVCHVTCKHGMHSKLTGAGGGGCAITLIRPGTSDKSVSDVTRELSSLGFTVWNTCLGDDGVALHVTS